MPKFKRRPQDVEAHQWFPEQPHTVHTDSMKIDYREWECGVFELSEGQLFDEGCRFMHPVKSTTVVWTSTGRTGINPGDWIIEHDGRRDVLSAEEFEKLYESC
jgi:hypothetical protein